MKKKRMKEEVEEKKWLDAERERERERKKKEGKTIIRTKILKMANNGSVWSGDEGDRKMEKIKKNRTGR